MSTTVLWGNKPCTCSRGDSNDTSEAKQVNQTHSLTLDCFERMISRNTLFLDSWPLTTRSFFFVLPAPFTTSAHETDVVFAGTAALLLLRLLARCSLPSSDRPVFLTVWYIVYSEYWKVRQSTPPSWQKRGASRPEENLYPFVFRLARNRLCRRENIIAEAK